MSAGVLCLLVRVHILWEEKWSKCISNSFTGVRVGDIIVGVWGQNLDQNILFVVIFKMNS